MTNTQRQALINARDFGNVWYYRVPQVGGFTMVWSASKQRMHNRLRSAGLIHSDGTITGKGLTELNEGK